MAPHAVSSEVSQADGSVHDEGHGRPLKVIIVGAGIAGISAALGLRRAGHEVEVGVALVNRMGRAQGHGRSSNRLPSAMKWGPRSTYVQTLHDLCWLGVWTQ